LTNLLQGSLLIAAGSAVSPNETGLPEIYEIEFPGPGSRWQVLLELCCAHFTGFGAMTAESLCYSDAVLVKDAAGKLMAIDIRRQVQSFG